MDDQMIPVGCDGISFEASFGGAFYDPAIFIECAAMEAAAIAIAAGRQLGILVCAFQQ